MGLIVLFQLIFTFIYSTFSKKFSISAKWVDPKPTLNGDLQLLATMDYFWIVKFMMGTILTLKSNDAATASLCICLVELFQILLVHQTDPTAIHNRVLMRTLKYNLNLTAFNVLNSSKPIIMRQKQYPNVARKRCHPEENFKGIVTLRQLPHDL